MQNVKQIWKETAKQLEKVYDQREAENISYLLLEDLFEVKRVEVLSGDEKEIDQTLLKDSVERLLKYEPVQYVTGVADFYGRKFQIEAGALIPRPETEELCELIINENSIANPKVLDVGVGSGCITITLALELGGDVTGVDVSESALRIAEKNSNSLGSKVRFVHADVLINDPQIKELDILVSNPPYIPESDRSDMKENVTQFEPEVALFVPNDDPLIFYKKIGMLGIDSLKSGGKLYFEIHEKFGKEVKSYLEEIGYSDVLIHQDMQEKDRMISAINSASK